ncbi:MAG: hypothetical protein ACRCXN_11695 [Bacteroidales bacterium]
MNVGRIIKDFYCNGFSGRRYDLTNSVIEAEGNDWIVIRTEEGEPILLVFDKDYHNKQELIDKWCEE